MVSITSLWLPILLSAGIVFAVSSIIHMVLTYHRSDYRKVPDEDGVMEALRRFSIPPGDYVIPCASGPQEMKSPGFLERRTRGPVAVLTVMPAGPPRIGKSLVQWFVYSLAVGLFGAYIAGRALPPGAEYLAVFRFVGTTAFLGYGLALLNNSIWLGRGWGATVKSIFDALVYGLLTAGTFGWLWPEG